MAKYCANIRFYLPFRKSLLRKRTINEENQPINLFSMILRKGKGLPNAKRGEGKIKEGWKRRFQSFNFEQFNSVEKGVGVIDIFVNILRLGDKNRAIYLYFC